MNENVFDVFGIPTVAIPDNAVLQWDGCDWKFIELPASTLTCQDIVDCVQPELDNLWAAVNGKLECSDLAACQTIVDIVADIAALPASILSQIVYYTQTNNDGANTTKPNGATTEFTGVMGLQVTTNSISEAIEVALPGGATDGDVMVWDETLGVAVRTTVIDCLCEQISTCSVITTLQAMQTSLQNQINYLLGLDPSQQPVLTCSDVANCIWTGATDVDSALDHFITSRSNWVDLLVNIQNIETEVAAITIRDCNDVAACPLIVDLIDRISNAEGDITAHAALIETNRLAIELLNMEFMNFQIRDCNDVMACQGITDLVNQVAMNQGEITVNAGRIDTNEMMVTQHTTDILNINNELSMIQIRTCGDVMACSEIQDISSMAMTNEGRSMTNEGNIMNIQNDVMNLQNELTTCTIRDCNDIMACGGIIDLVGQTAVNDGRITALEGCCGNALAVSGDSGLVDDNVTGLSFTGAAIAVTQVSPGAVNVEFSIPGFWSIIGTDLTDHYHAYWDNTANKLVDSLIYEESGRVGFGTTNTADGAYSFDADGMDPSVFVLNEFSAGTGLMSRSTVPFYADINPALANEVNAYNLYCRSQSEDGMSIQHVVTGPSAHTTYGLRKGGLFQTNSETGGVFISKGDNAIHLATGSWQMIVDPGTGNLIYQYYDGSSWVTKQTISI